MFTFEQDGIYVFADSNQTAKQTIVAVMDNTQSCPSNTVYASMTQANLLKVGIALKRDIVYSPDWKFFIGILIAIIMLLFLSVFVVGYVYRKSWEVKNSLQEIPYQGKQYKMVKNEDPED